MSDNQHQRDQMASAQRDHESEPERPDAAPHESHVFGERFCERCGYAKDSATAKYRCRGKNVNLVAPPNGMQDNCPTCGTLMKVVEDGEGVFHYAHPEDAPGGPWWIHTAEDGWTLQNDDCDPPKVWYFPAVTESANSDTSFTMEIVELFRDALNKVNHLKGDET